MGRNILDMKLGKGFLGIIFLIFTSRAFPNAVFQDQDNFQDEVKFEDIDSNPQKEVRAHEIILPIKSSSMLKNLFHFPFYVNYKRDSNPHVRVIKSIKNRDQKLDSHIRVMRSDHDLSSQIRVMRAEPKRSMLEDTKNFKDDDSKMNQDSQLMLRMQRSVPTQVRVTRSLPSMTNSALMSRLADWDEPQVRVTRSEENYTPQIRIVLSLNL